MAKYVLKFSKEGYIKYTSHLDMLRLFKRSFKKAGINLEYSQGFNPHPKLGFVQPLSLGYTSIGELLEFTTKKEWSLDEIIEKLDIIMPEGIRIIECKRNEATGKSLAAKCDSAEYIIAIPIEDGFSFNSDITEAFLNQDHILVKKKKKKSNEYKEINIKNMIRELTIIEIDNTLFMSTILDAGSNSNLSPELLLQGFFAFMQWELHRENIEILRKKIICK